MPGDRPAGSAVCSASAACDTVCDNGLATVTCGDNEGGALCERCAVACSAMSDPSKLCAKASAYRGQPDSLSSCGAALVCHDCVNTRSGDGSYCAIGAT